MSAIIEASDVACASAAFDLSCAFHKNLSPNERVALVAQLFADLSAGAANARGEYGMHRDGYKDIWEDINGAGSWAINPFVWCLTFKRVT